MAQRPASPDLPLTGKPWNPEERGTLIGLGGQYSVHDVGSGRVIKIPNSMDGTRKFIGGWGPHVAGMKRHRPLAETAEYRDICVPHVLRLAARYPPLSRKLANPRKEEGHCFSQDLARPLLSLFPEASAEKVREWLAEALDRLQRHEWKGRTGVRLQNAVYAAAASARVGAIQVGHLPDGIRG